jgi:hypothetical protein
MDPRIFSGYNLGKKTFGARENFLNQLGELKPSIPKVCH